MKGKSLLLMLICMIGAFTSEAQTETTQPDQAQSSQALPKKTNITPGFKIIGGDIQVPQNFSPESTFEIKLWPNGVVFFEFDDNVTQVNRNAMLAAMNEWTRVANITFRAGRGMFGGFPIFIHIQNSDKNNSAVGVVLFGQTMNITSWGSRFIMAHELGHALGLLHEHSRRDRDTFVTIKTNNIQSGQADQFDLLSDSGAYGPYDFDSVMHYSQCSFSVGCGVDGMGNPITNCNNCGTQQTISINAPYNTQLSPTGVPWPAAIGQRTHLSYLDGVTMSFLYPRGDFRFVDAAFNLPPPFKENGSFLFPYKRFLTGFAATPHGGTLWIQPGAYIAVGTLNKPMLLRAPLGGVTIRRGDIPLSGGGPLSTVSAASYNGELAVEAIATAFGSELSLETASASSLLLPTTLGGVTVRVKDSDGVERNAPLFYVSPSQINYLVPRGTSGGVATVSVVRNLIVATGEIAINTTAPGLFSANASGRGVAAGYALRVRGDAQFVEPVLRFDEGQNRFVPVPIDLGPESDQVFLILFGTGFRSHSSLNAVTLMIGDETAEVIYAGLAPGYAGLDQLNALLPRRLAGKGEVNIVLTADDRSANAVTVSVR